MSLKPVESLDVAAKRKAIEDALRAEGEAFGYERGRAERFTEVAGVYGEQIAALRIDGEKGQARAYRHGRGDGIWMGGAGGFVAGFIIMLIAVHFVMNGTFDASARFQVQQDVVNTLERVPDLPPDAR